MSNVTYTDGINVTSSINITDINNGTNITSISDVGNGTDIVDFSNNIFARYPSVLLLMERFAPTSVLAERMVPPLWYLLGFMGNPISALVWSGRRMRRNNSSAVYLSALAVSDTIFLLLHLLYMLHVAWGHDVYNRAGGCEVFMMMFYAPQYMSVLLVAAFTAERYVAVCHPFLKEKWCTVRRACVATSLCLLLSLGIASVQAYIWTFHEPLNICNTRPSAAEGDHRSFWNVWTWAVEVVVFLALPLVVLLFNVLVLREIVRLSNDGVITRQQGRSHSSGSSTTTSTLTLLCVSFFFVVTQLTATIVTNLQLAFPTGSPFLTDSEVLADPAWSSFFAYIDWRKVLETICISHFAVYFIIYCLTGKHFRREVVYLLSCYGRLSCMQKALSRSRSRERYSMVSSNGQSFTATTTCSTTAM